MDDNKVKWTRKVRRYLRDAFSWLDTGLMLNALLINRRGALARFFQTADSLPDLPVLRTVIIQGAVCQPRSFFHSILADTLP